MSHPIGYRTMLEMAHKIYRAVKDGDIERAQTLSALLSQLEGEFPEAKQKLDEDYPRSSHARS